MADTHNSNSDEELIALLRQGDESAFAEIYERYWEKMATYAIKLIKSEDEGADIVQEIFVSIWNRREVLELKGTLVSYLIKSTKNLSLRYIERNITKHNFLDNLLVSIQNSSYKIEDDLTAKQIQEKVDEVVSQLPSKM